MIVPDSFSKLDEETKLEKVQKVKGHWGFAWFCICFKWHTKANIFSHDDNNMFVLNTQNYDFETQGEYRSAINNINKLIYETQVKTIRKQNWFFYDHWNYWWNWVYEIYLKCNNFQNATMHMVNYNHLFDNKKILQLQLFLPMKHWESSIKSFKAAKFKNRFTYDYNYSVARKQ